MDDLIGTTSSSAGAQPPPTRRQGKRVSVDGYISGTTPDTSWWLKQVNAGMVHRKEMAHEADWDRWRKYYRGQWNRTILPSNIFFKMLRTTVPRIYFRNPSVSISARHSGYEALAFAKVLERVDNDLIVRMNMKQEMKKIIQASFMFGTGFGKLGYGAEFSFTPDTLGDVTAPLHKNKYRVEYNNLVQDNMPWFMGAHPGSIVLPSGVDCMGNSRWIANWISRSADDIRNDSRLKNNRNLKVADSSTIATTGGKMNAKFAHATDMINLLEIKDKKTGMVFVISPYQQGNKVLFSGQDDLQINGRVPYYDLVFNEDDQYAWGTPDSLIMEPVQLEINETKTQIMKHRRLSLIKIIAKRNSISPEEAAKLVDGTIDPIIWAEENPNNVMKHVQAAQIPQELFTVLADSMNELRESMGFSRNEFGEFNPGSSDTTAFEASVVSQASAIRVDERRDMVADLLTEVMKDIHHIIFNRWNEDQVIDVVGPDGSIVWVSFKGNSLGKSQYNVSIDPDSSLPETKGLKEQKAIKMFEMLKGDPMVDQAKLYRNLMRNLQGTQYDDMLIEDLGSTIGANPDQPMPMEEFSKQFQSPQAQAAISAGGSLGLQSNGEGNKDIGNSSAPSGATSPNGGF